jgi:hypothetical protein
MRLFQNSALYPAYVPRLRRLEQEAGARSFDQRIGVFLDDRFGAPHFLQPVLAREAEAFFANGDDEPVQRQWAREHGLPDKLPLADILLAQIEHHRTDVFYNLDPVRYASDFVQRLPGCVKRTVAWRAAPSPGADFGAYGAVVCNFSGILDGYRARGWRAEWLAPAHDPEMNTYAGRQERPVDVVFVGGYTRHHRRRAALLEAVAALGSEATIAFHLDSSRLTRLAESPAGRLLPLGLHRRPAAIRQASQAPVFGRDLYTALSNAKLVLNGAIDMAGEDRGNMRCFEALGCGCLMLSDEGRYPPGMIAGSHFATYSDPAGAVQAIRRALREGGHRSPMALAGHSMIQERFGKARQWSDFRAIVQ